jgi:FG-GAP-like repeat
LANLGNGKTDIVVQQNGDAYSTPPVPGDVRVYLGRGNGTFAPPTQYLANTYGGGGLAVADVIAHGKPDIVMTVATYNSKEHFLTDSKLVVLPNKGDGTFGKPISTLQADQVPFLSDIAVGDFNGDGKLDVAQGDCCGLANTYIFFGNGDGTFQAPVTLGIGGSSTSLSAVNITSTKYPDLIVASSANEIGSDVVLMQNLYGANLSASDTSSLRQAPTTDPAGGDTNSGTAAKASPSEMAKPAEISGAPVSARLR